MKANEARQFARVGRRSLVYGALALLSGLFVWPLVWMVGTSFKSSQEILDSPPGVLPPRPVPRVRSPYVDDRQFDLAGTPVSPAAQRIVGEALREAGYPWPDGVDARAARETAARGVCRRLANLTAADFWRRPEPELRRALRARLTPDLIDDACRRTLRELLLGSLRVRSRDLDEEELIPARDAATAWQVSSGAPASLGPVVSEGRPAARLSYDFGRDAQLIRLTQTFHPRTGVDGLARLQLSLRPDESWNSVRLLVEQGGVLYQGGQSTPLADHAHWTVLTWQPPGPDDQSNKIRTWITLRAVARGPQYAHGAHELKVTLELRRVGALGAWGAKLRRNYALALDYLPFWRYVATSLFLVILSVSGTLGSCSLVAYSFARLKWPGRDLCFLLLLATLMIPSQVTLMPQFLILRDLGWYNTLRALWAPHFFGSAFYIFLLRQFFKGVPRDLEDAARMDGCGPLGIYFHVMLPLAKPPLAAVAVLSFMANWNDFMGPLIYVADQRLYPLSLGLYAFTVQANAEAGLGMGMTMAGSLLMTLPVVVIFLLAQRYFIRSALLSGLKG